MNVIGYDDRQRQVVEQKIPEGPIPRPPSPHKIVVGQQVRGGPRIELDTACLADAFDAGDIVANPAAGLRIRSTRTAGHEEHVKVLSRAQLGQLLDLIDPRHQALVRLLATTGMRINEALAVQWRSVDLGANPSVSVTRAVKKLRGKSTFGPPKSKYGERTSGGLLEFLGRRPRLLDRCFERLYSPLESPMTSADRRHTALRRFLAELALETVDAIREPLDAHPTCVPVGDRQRHRARPTARPRGHRTYPRRPDSTHRAMTRSPRPVP